MRFPSDDFSTANANLDLDLARKRLGAEQLIKLLEVKSVNATAMKLFWRVRCWLCELKNIIVNILYRKNTRVQTGQKITVPNAKDRCRPDEAI